MALTNADFITYGELVSAMFPEETLTTKVDALITQAETLYPDSEKMQKAWVYVTCYQQAINYWSLAGDDLVFGSSEININTDKLLARLTQSLNKWTGIFSATDNKSTVLQNMAVW